MKKELPTRKELAGAMFGKRTQLNIGVRQAAKSLGVSPATYSRMENGKPMTLENYIKAINWTALL